MSFRIDVQVLRERAAKRAAEAATAATQLPEESSKVATVAGQRDQSTSADAWCWPHSEAMNCAELLAFTSRRDRLMRWGWPESEAENLAERLARRDRECDERVTCVDCQHYRSASGRCGNAEKAELAAASIGRDLPTLLQRCKGFDAHEYPAR
jgi:hypothetical protein